MEGVKFKEAKQNDRGAPGTQLLLYFMQKKISDLFGCFGRGKRSKVS